MSELTENSQLLQDIVAENNSMSSSPTSSTTHVRPKWLDFEANDYDMSNRKSLSYDSNKPTYASKANSLNMRHSQYAPQSPNYTIGIIKSSQNVSSLSCTSSSSSCSSFVHDMPQWKKDLIQRRKKTTTNVARTTTADDDVNAIGTTSAKVSPVLPLISNNPNSHAVNDEGLIGIGAAAADYVDHDDVADKNIKCEALTISSTKATNHTKVQKQQQSTSQQQQQTVIGTRNQTNATLAPLAATKIITIKKNCLAAVVEQQKEPRQQQHVKTKMPATNTKNELTIATTTATAAILVKSPTSPNIREKAEKLLCSSSSGGGHYTPMATLLNERVRLKSDDFMGMSKSANSADVAVVEHNIITATTKTINNYNEKNNNNNSSSTVLKKQRSLYLATSPSSTLTSSSSSFSSFSNTNINSSGNQINSSFNKPIALYAKESTTTGTSSSSSSDIMASTNKQKAEIIENNIKIEVKEEEEEEKMQEIKKRKPTSLSFGVYGTQVDIKNLDSTIKASGAQQTPLAQQQVANTTPQQLHSKRDSERTSNSFEILTLTSALTSTSSTPTTTTTTEEEIKEEALIIKVSQRNDNKKLKISNNKSAIYGISNDINLSKNENIPEASVKQYSNIKSTAATATTVYKANKSKLFNTLQNNQFIKSQQEQPQGHINKKSKIPEEFSKIGDTATITKTSPTLSSVTGSSPTKPKLLYASAVASASGVNSNNNNKKKMVAVQEMKKTTQNVSHHPHHHHHHNNNHQRHHQQIIGDNNVNCGIDEQQQQHQTNNNNNNIHVSYDSGEDLSYGPGIVEKLRDRYLSWATRESMVEKQRRSLETLRRATSLCTLLDREQALDNDDDDDDVDNDNENPNDNDVDDENADGDDDNNINENDVEQLSEIINVPQITPVPAQRHGDCQKYHKKSPSGILKITNNTVVDAMKKTAKFENNINGNKNENENNTITPKSGKQNVEYMSRSQNENSGRGSRAIKRGNDSLKRARSVEALLSERAAWNFIPTSTTGKTLTNNNNYNVNNNSGGVTIEDKIHNARDRLIMGTDIMPPKRLTSIIDETERPPPDLVKLTLKKFEATANRRPRTTRGNSNGEVANKVATFKSIINEQKPAVVLPKPTSPIKRQVDMSNLKPVAKPVILPASEDLLLTSPTAHRGQHKTTTIGLSEHTPDLIPRQKHLLIASNSTSNATTDSPVTALTKKMERMRIKNNSSSNNNINNNKNNNEGNGISIAPTIAVDSPVTALTKRIQKMHITTEYRKEKLPQEIATDNSDIESQSPTSHDDKCEKILNNNVKVPDDDSGCNNNMNKQQQQQYGVDDAAAIVNNVENNDGDGNAVVAAVAAYDRSKRDDDEVNSVVFGVVDKQNDKQTLNYNSVMEARTFTKTTTTTTTAAAAAVAAAAGDTVETGIGSPSSSVFSDDEDSLGLTKRVTRKALENIAKAGTTLQYKFANFDSLSENQSQNNNNTNIKNNKNTNNNNNNMRPLISSATTSTAASVRQKSAAFVSPLTSREIEKNRINELKKTDNNHSSVSSPNTGQSELDASASVASANPLWGAMCKRRIAPPVAVAENTSMVFNFSNRKEVPDYIENDGVIFRRKRELPKPNESGFVMLGDLTVETSTDSDYDDFSMCPPSPCDVEFENANIVIDGKSSIRQKAKNASCRVQFNDTLTSTFEYPSEMSMVIDDDTFTSPYRHNTDTSILSAYENLVLEEPDSPTNQRHHHVAVDEIIPLPNYSPHINVAANNNHNHINTSINNSSVTTNTPTKNVLGNLPLDYPNLMKGIMLQQAAKSQQQQKLQESEEHVEKKVSKKATRPTNLPIKAIEIIKPILLDNENFEKKLLVEIIKAKDEIETQVHSKLKTADKVNKSNLENSKLESNVVTADLDLFVKRNDVATLCETKAKRNDEPAKINYDTNRENDNDVIPNYYDDDHHHNYVKNNCEVAQTVKQMSPLLRRIYKPPILHGYQLASMKPHMKEEIQPSPNNIITTRTTTTTTYSATTLGKENLNNNYKEIHKESKISNVLNKPQYACFLKSREIYEQKQQQQQQQHQQKQQRDKKLTQSLSNDFVTMQVYKNNNENHHIYNNNEKQKTLLPPIHISTTKRSCNSFTYCTDYKRKTANNSNSIEYNMNTDNVESPTITRKVANAIALFNTMSTSSVSSSSHNNNNNNNNMSSVKVISNLRNQQVRHSSFNCPSSHRAQSKNVFTSILPVTTTSNTTSIRCRSSPLTSSFKLSNASAAILQNRIPGSTLYYV